MVYIFGVISLFRTGKEGRPDLGSGRLFFVSPVVQARSCVTWSL